jgi:hypothetical protein
LLGGALAASAQPIATEIGQVKFNSGQNVVPVYEGWMQNSDGSFSFVFGYFNRNWQEELSIPAGPDNKLEPGAPDRGQPTYFLPRRQSWLFRVQVPKDWGQKELIWTINAHGRPEKAYAQLLPEYEITERLIMTRGGLNPGLDDPNKPPSITIVPVQTASVASPVTLTALVTDDGLPKPRPPKVRPAGSQPQAQSNNTGTGARAGLSVTWMQFGGPAKVTFDATGPIAVTDGKALTTARFPEPGTYVLLGTANDGALSVKVPVTITVGN